MAASGPEQFKPLEVDVSDVFVRSAYLDMLFLWQGIYIWGDDTKVADAEIRSIAEDNGLNDQETSAIAGRAAKNVLQLGALPVCQEVEYRIPQ